MPQTITESAGQTKSRQGNVLGCGCAALALLLLLTGCLGKQTAQGNRQASVLASSAGDFSGQWWDFYKRGLFLAEEGREQEAMADFREAMAQRDHDQWQAVIGPGRALDYFPHRELGVLLVTRNEFAKAIPELEHSLTSAPSARASFFLNRARVGKTIRDETDSAPPAVHFAGSSTPETTSNCRKTVTGVASDDTFVATLTVGGQPVPLPLPEKRKAFKIELTLTEGKNTIMAAATDLTGKRTEQALEITCDRRGPRIEIEKLTPGEGTVTVKGNVSDDQGLGTLTVNGQLWPVTGKAAGYNFEFSLPDNKITFVATDRAGNVTGAQVRQAEFDLEEDAGRPTGPPKSESLDNTPPVIRVEGLGSDEETLAETAQLTAQIMDNSLLAYVSVNGEEILNQKGRRLYFSQKLPLREGKNSLRIIAADEYGNKASRTVTITRRTESPGLHDSRLRLALLPFTGGNIAGQAERFGDRLHQAFLDQGRFALAEPDRIAAVSRELYLSPDAPVPPAEAARLGRAVAAQAVLTGRVTATGDGGVEIVGQLIDTGTATLLARNDVYGQSGEATTTDSLLAGLASLFAGDFPPIEGTILEVQGREVLLDLTPKQQVRALRRLLCYRVSPPARHPVTGASLPPEQEFLGELQVIEVAKDSVRAKIMTQKGDLLRGDRVVAR